MHPAWQLSFFQPFRLLFAPYSSHLPLAYAFGLAGKGRNCIFHFLRSISLNENTKTLLSA
jgi:hypothetical protein